MTTTYEICYYLNYTPTRYMYVFQSLWAAVFKARMIYEEHGISADVRDCTTGEVLAIFDPDSVWTADGLPDEVEHCAKAPLE